MAGRGGAPPLAVGDLVDVLAVMPGAGLAGPGSDGAGQEPAFALVERAAVVDVADDAVTVAVPGGDAPRVAWALSNGAVVLALGGG
jgi:hypothetical protein